MPLPRRRLVLLAALLAALAAALGAYALTRGEEHEGTADRCPPGFKRESDAGAQAHRASEDSDAGDADQGACLRIGHPETKAEVMAANSQFASRNVAPFTTVRPGAGAAAVRQADALAATRSTVAGASGAWTPLGTTPLVANDTDYDQTNGSTQEGFVNLSGRVEDFAYDAAHNALYAAPVNGGVWRSDDMGGHWRSVGDSLPTQVVGSIAYSPAAGGTLVALTGDPAFGFDSSSGLGIYRSTDGGRTWERAAGSPSGVLGFQLAVDPTNPNVIYAATGAGLYRSTDDARSFTNVLLPTGRCAGHTLDYLQPAYKDCFLANEVTDVVVQGAANGATTGADAKPGAVLAAVGWRAGTKQNADGSQQSPANGIYTSTTGAPGSFTRVDTSASGFAGGDQTAIGRVALGIANGAQQDHRVVYALVEDANRFNGKQGADVLDEAPTGAPGSTVLNGVWVSSDFGQHWTRMESSTALTSDPTSGSALEPAGKGLSYEPGVQSWYNEWIAPDPTAQTSAGVPTRVVFGLEELWENDQPPSPVPPQPQNGPSTFRVIGRYWNSCDFVLNGAPKCGPGRGNGSAQANTTTTHPDQHAGLFVPDGKGGVTLVAGSDGGAYTQHVAAGSDFSNNDWGDGSQGAAGAVLHTLQPYDAEVANDGTVYMGMQDNGEGKILPDGHQYEIFGGDGFFTAVQPDHPDTAYEEYTGGDISVTTDGGKTWTDINPTLTSPQFSTPFMMDPTDSQHLLVGGREVKETTFGPQTTAPGTPPGPTDWQTVYDLGTRDHPGDASASASGNDVDNSTSAVDVRGDDAYVGFCGYCDTITGGTPFKSGLATNVGGSTPPKRMTSNGWHIAAAHGLPNRYITSVAMDPANPRTVFVTLGGYGRKWAPPGAVGDSTAGVGTGHVFKSTDAGEHFTDVSGQLPDSPTNWVIVRGGQLVVGDDVGAFISSDLSGSTWTALGSGLPHVPVLHLQLKPNDPDTMVVATYGRGVYSYKFAGAGSGGVNGGGSSGAGAGCGPRVIRSWGIDPRGRRVRVRFSAPVRTVSVDVFQHTRGRSILYGDRVAHFNARRSFTWNGRANLRHRRVSDGIFSIRLVARSGRKVDTRELTLIRVHGRWHHRVGFFRPATCDNLKVFTLGKPAFGGTRNAPLTITFSLRRATSVYIQVLRTRGHVVKVIRAGRRAANRTYRYRLAARAYRRGDYKVRIQLGGGRHPFRTSLMTRRL